MKALRPQRRESRHTEVAWDLKPIRTLEQVRRIMADRGERMTTEAVRLAEIRALAKLAAALREEADADLGEVA